MWRQNRGRWDLLKPKPEELGEERAAVPTRDVPAGWRGAGGARGVTAARWGAGKRWHRVQAPKLETEHQSKVSGVLSQKPVGPVAKGVGNVDPRRSRSRAGGLIPLGWSSELE